MVSCYLFAAFAYVVLFVIPFVCGTHNASFAIDQEATISEIALQRRNRTALELEADGRDETALMRHKRESSEPHRLEETSLMRRKNHMRSAVVRPNADLERANEATREPSKLRRRAVVRPNADLELANEDQTDGNFVSGHLASFGSQGLQATTQSILTAYKVGTFHQSVGGHVLSEDTIAQALLVTTTVGTISTTTAGALTTITSSIAAANTTVETSNAASTRDILSRVYKADFSSVFGVVIIMMAFIGGAFLMYLFTWSRCSDAVVRQGSEDSTPSAPASIFRRVPSNVRRAQLETPAQNRVTQTSPLTRLSKLAAGRGLTLDSDSSQFRDEKSGN